MLITVDRNNKTAPSDFGGTLHSDAAFSKAALEGELVVLPRDNELFIDIDNEASLVLFYMNLPKIEEYVGVRGYPVITPSRSGDAERRHIVVTLSQDVTKTERILLQAVLGSDLRRELLSYCRITIGDPNPTLFLEKNLKLLPEQGVAA